VISVQDASNASHVNLSSAIVDLNHVLRRRSIENVRSADAAVTGTVVRTLSSNPPDSPLFETLCRTADEELFKNIIAIRQFHNQDSLTYFAYFLPFQSYSTFYLGW